MNLNKKSTFALKISFMRLLSVFLLVMFALPVLGQRELPQSKKDIDTTKLKERMARGAAVKDPTDT
ncbi:MAG: hypothetical protein WBN56_02960, partial [Robiginitalea sp.]